MPFENLTPKQARLVKKRDKYVKKKKGNTSRLSKARKTLRRSGNVKRSRVRENDWTARVEQDWDEIDHSSLERVMPRDERDRRRQIEQAVITSPLTSDREDRSTRRDGTSRAVAGVDVQTALVTEVAGMSAQVEIDGAGTGGYREGAADRDRHRLHKPGCRR